MLNNDDLKRLDFEKGNGLMPAVIQNAVSGRVLMLGYMNREALDKTINSGKVTFWSRSKNRLWTKGETSGNFLDFVDVALDCDGDSLLILVNPQGPTCHLGKESCFGDLAPAHEFLARLEKFWLSGKPHRQKALTPHLFMPEAQKESLRKSEKRRLKQHWQRPCMIGKRRLTRRLICFITCWFFYSRRIWTWPSSRKT